jgi:hypothetical protein
LTYDVEVCVVDDADGQPGADEAGQSEEDGASSDDASDDTDGDNGKPRVMKDEFVDELRAATARAARAAGRAQEEQRKVRPCAACMHHLQHCTAQLARGCHCRRQRMRHAARGCSSSERPRGARRQLLCEWRLRRCACDCCSCLLL